MKLRRIIVNNLLYLWKREHIHISEYKFSPCLEKITIYLNGNKKSPLRLFFKGDDNGTIQENFETGTWCLHGVGNGIIWQYSPSELNGTDVMSINFNRPAVIKDIIVYFLGHGWKPENNTAPLEINDALKYLSIIEFECR